MTKIRRSVPKSVLYDDGDKIVLRRDDEASTISENWYTEITKSALQLISETDQRYQARIDISTYEEDNGLNPEVELWADPGTVDYYLEPGEAAEVKREIEGEILVNGDRIPANIRFESELYSENLNTVLHYNFPDPKLEALAEESVTVKMSEKPVRKTQAV